MQMCFAINIAQQRSRLYGHLLQFRFNGHSIHRREIDYDTIIAQGPAGDVVAAAFDRNEKIVRARKLHGEDDIRRSRTAGY
jgi:hypothetical protein